MILDAVTVGPEKSAPVTIKEEVTSGGALTTHRPKACVSSEPIVNISMSAAQILATCKGTNRPYGTVVTPIRSTVVTLLRSTSFTTKSSVV